MDLNMAILICNFL